MRQSRSTISRSKNAGDSECTRSTIRSREVGLQRVEAGGNPLLRALGQIALRGGAAGGIAIPPGQEFGIAGERIHVYLPHAFAEQSAPALGAADVAAPRRLDEPRLRQIATRPIEPIGENRLLPARHQPAQLLGGDLQRLGELVLDARDMHLFEPLTSQRRASEASIAGKLGSDMRSSHPKHPETRRLDRRVETGRKAQRKHAAGLGSAR